MGLLDLIRNPQGNQGPGLLEQFAGSPVGKVASLPLDLLAAGEAARHGQSPLAPFQQSAVQRQQLQNIHTQGVAALAGLVQDPAGQAFLQAHPEIGQSLGLLPQAQGMTATPAGTATPPLTPSIGAPQVETTNKAQLRQLDANIEWINAYRHMMMGGESPETHDQAAPIPGTPAMLPATHGHGTAAPGTSGVDAPGSGYFWEFGPSGPTKKPRRLTTMKLAAGTPLPKGLITDPSSGQPMLRTPTGDTIFVTQPSPGQLQVGERARTSLDALNAMESALNDPQNKDARASLGPMRLLGFGVPEQNASWIRYSKYGGKSATPFDRDNTPAEQRLMEAVGYFDASGYQGLLSGVRNKAVIDDIKVHLPHPWDPEATIRQKIDFLRQRYGEQLKQNPSALIAGMAADAGAAPDEVQSIIQAGGGGAPGGAPQEAPSPGPTAAASAGTPTPPPPTPDQGGPDFEAVRQRLLQRYQTGGGRKVQRATTP